MANHCMEIKYLIMRDAIMAVVRLRLRHLDFGSTILLSSVLLRYSALLDCCNNRKPRGARPSGAVPVPDTVISVKIAPG